MNSFVSVNGLEKRYDKKPVLSNITASVMPGDVIALLGKNGAGKSTLMETLLGFKIAAQGKAELFGVNAVDIGDDIKQRIGFVPQQSELLGFLKVSDQLALFKKFRPKWNDSLVDRLVEQWEIPLDKTAGKLSVGQQQKLSILLAIGHDPDLLVLDEPVASLDPIARRKFLQEIVRLSFDQNKAIIFSTHIISDVERVANRVWMLQGGSLTLDKNLDDLKESVVRVYVPNEDILNCIQKYKTAYKIHKRQDGYHINYIDWSAQDERHFAEIEGSPYRVEYLTLEEMFMDLNDEN